MTHKFKAGDKVVVKEEIDNHKIGDILTCIAVDYDGDPIFFGDTTQDVGWPVWEDFFELYEDVSKKDNNEPQPDNVNHPSHYTSHPSGIECIQITEHLSFCIGNAIKYLWRADLKKDAIEDLQKASWYINREIKRRGGAVEGE